jgi:hypothetical protein
MDDSREEQAITEWLAMAWAIEDLTEARDRARLWLIEQGVV